MSNRLGQQIPESSSLIKLIFSCAGITIGLYWDDYITAALEYIKEKVMEKECLEIS